MLSLVYLCLLKSATWLALAAVPFTPVFAAVQAENTRTLVLHSLRATVQIPADWQYTTIGNYAGADGEQLGWGIVPSDADTTLENACQSSTQLPPLAGNTPMTEFIEVKGQLACKITSSVAKNLTVLVIQHPYPFEVPRAGYIEYVAYWSNATHFDEITDSLDFDPEHVIPADYMAAVLDFVQANSYYRDRVRWDSLRAFILDGTADETDLSSVEGRMEDMITVLQGVGDTHTVYFSPEAMQQVFATSSSQSNVELPEGKRLTATTGYIQLSGILGYNAVLQEYAQTGQAVIRQIDEDPVACWIIDLRRDWGGTMLPMLQVVAPIIGDGVIEQFVQGSGEDVVISLQDGKVFYDDIQALSFIEENYQLQRPNPPTAVLIGHGTGSAGENTAIAFIGRPQTRLFGQHSARLTIGNIGLPLFDGGGLTLAAVVSADRNGTPYPDGIEPDVTVEEDGSALDSPDNPVMAAALAWLQDEMGC